MVGELIRARRVALGLSQTELARRAGSSQRQVSRLENGEERTVPRRDTLDRFGAVLGISLAEFYAAAGILDPQDTPVPAPRTLTLQTRQGARTVDLARAIAYVEAVPDDAHQRMLARWRATLPPADYERLVARIYAAWTEHSGDMFAAMETIAGGGDCGR